MSTNAMNNRLLRIKTTDFGTQPDDMLNVSMRIISDRGSRQAFYKNYELMDDELLGGGGRAAMHRRNPSRTSTIGKG